HVRTAKKGNLGQRGRREVPSITGGQHESRKDAHTPVWRLWIELASRAVKRADRCGRAGRSMEFTRLSWRPSRQFVARLAVKDFSSGTSKAFNREEREAGRAKNAKRTRSPHALLRSGGGVAGLANSATCRCHKRGPADDLAPRAAYPKLHFRWNSEQLEKCVP